VSLPACRGRLPFHRGHLSWFVYSSGAPSPDSKTVATEKTGIPRPPAIPCCRRVHHCPWCTGKSSERNSRGDAAGTAHCRAGVLCFDLRPAGEVAFSPGSRSNRRRHQRPVHAAEKAPAWAHENLREPKRHPRANKVLSPEGAQAGIQLGTGQIPPCSRGTPAVGTSNSASDFRRLHGLPASLRRRAQALAGSPARLGPVASTTIISSPTPPPAR